MSKFKTAKNLLFNDRKALIEAAYENFRRSKLSHVVPDRIYIMWTYQVYFGNIINLRNPKTFNEKLNWLKLNYRYPVMTTMVDKAEVKKYVAGIIGDQYIIPTIGVWDKVEDIPWSSLPNQFVIKGVHDSSSVIICQDKQVLSIEAAREKLNRSLQTNLYYWGREWPYKNLKPRIIAEQLLVSSDGSEVKDYKFFCFNGIVKVFKIDFNRFVEHRANYYDRQGNLLDIGEVVCPPDTKAAIKMPFHVDLMIELAEELSKGYPFLRVDFYEVDAKVYFGELTFYPASAFGRFTDDAWDKMMGSWLLLPNHR